MSTCCFRDLTRLSCRAPFERPGFQQSARLGEIGMPCARRKAISGTTPMNKITLRLVAGILGLLAATLAFAQTSDFTPEMGDQSQTGLPPQSGGANRSTAPNPANVSPSVTPANGSLSVNPITGLAAVSSKNYRPLTGKQRWQLYWRQNYFSVGAYFGPVFTSLVLDQATGSPRQWGGGFRGYGLRLGSRTAMAMMQGTFQASLAAALHEDVRYISSGETGFKKRALHAVAFSFVTYNNQGRTTLNIANLSAYYATTAISTIWLPGQRNTATYTVTNGTEQIGLSVPVNMLQEFWPDIRRKVFRRGAPAQNGSGAIR